MAIGAFDKRDVACSIFEFFFQVCFGVVMISLKGAMRIGQLVGFVPLAVASSHVFAVEQFSVGDKVRVACERAPVYPTPSAFDVSSAYVEFGAGVGIVGLQGPFELPDSDYSSKKRLEQKAKNMAGEGTPRVVKPEEYTRYSWAEIGSSQFIPTSCLVTEKNFPDQTIERAEEKVAALASGKAKRNFSEDEEEGDMRAVRGAAGSAKGGAADYAGIDRLISQSQGIYDPAELMEFRKAGSLGEHK